MALTGSGNGVGEAGSRSDWEVCILDVLEERRMEHGTGQGTEGATQGEAKILVLSIPEFELLVQY